MGRERAVGSQHAVAESVRGSGRGESFKENRHARPWSLYLEGTMTKKVVSQLIRGF